MPTDMTRVAIVDFGLGNLYSVKHACAHAGLQAQITCDRAEILAADAAILPGVGAFGDAMATLTRLDLVSALYDFVAVGKPFLGICLGLQLLMRESEEFGSHKGLGIVDGAVVRFPDPAEGGRQLKVPHIGWNGIHRAGSARGNADPWSGTLLSGCADGESMYFVHSYIVQPADPGVLLSTSAYGDVEFCSSLRVRNITACQFHPERSGPRGLSIYRNLADQIHGSKERACASTA